MTLSDRGTTVDHGRVPQSVFALIAPPSASDETAEYEVLASAAHELRLPLSHIKGFVSTLRRTDITWDEQTRAEFLAEIELETDRLTQVLDSVLAVRDPRGGDPQSTQMALTSPAAVVEGGLHRLRGCLQPERWNHAVHVDVPSALPSIWMDANQMERVVANLVQNAIKYSPPASQINISARVTEDGELELCVEDEGLGVPPEDRERIFEPFFRNQTTDQSKVSGHGLGLAICQSIVLAHGGRMRVGDRPGGGARFSVFLPVQRTADTLHTTGKATNSSNRQHRRTTAHRRVSVRHAAA
jgi:two-component system, OmpR family, sensor histidine kinase KdpD